MVLITTNPRSVLILLRALY